MKYQLIIESETIPGLMQKIKDELDIMTEQEENMKNIEKAMKTKMLLS